MCINELVYHQIKRFDECLQLSHNHLASCSLRNFEFLLLHTAHFDKSIIVPFLVFATLGFLFPLFFLHFKR